MKTSKGISRRGLLERVPAVASAVIFSDLLFGCGRADQSSGSAAPHVSPSAAFLEVAKIATGGLALDGVLAARLYADLGTHYPDLDIKAVQLRQSLSALDGNGASLDQNPALAGLFEDLMGGLYLGVVGPQTARRCVAFESIESYALFDGVLAPPSYAGGAPGSWASSPTALPRPTGGL